MFATFKKLLLILPSLTGVLVNAYASPGACSGACWSHDPAVMQRASDGVYFRFSTGSGVQITKASSIAGPWTIEGYALPSGSSIALSGNTDLWVRPSWKSASTLIELEAGSRCSFSRKHLLHVLRRIFIWHAKLRYWICDIHHHGSGIMDRSWLSWNCLRLWEELQCDRSQSHKCFRNILHELRLLLGRYLSGRNGINAH